MANLGWSVLAHLACRTLLSVSLSPIPVTGSPALSGLVLFLPCDNWHQSTFPTGEALRGDTGFASVFGPQNEGHKFTRKCNLTLDTSMAKPTPKPLLRMVEREEYSECLGASVERPV